MSERRKRVQCGFCKEWHPPEATRLHPWVSGDPPRPTGNTYRRCIDCTERLLRSTDEVLREVLTDGMS